MSLDIHFLHEMLAQDAAAIAQLKQLLEQERGLLEQRKQEELPPIIEQKSMLADQLNQTARQRQHILEAVDLPATAQGWDLFLQRNASTMSLINDWRMLVAEFEACKKMNEINGKMVARSQQTLNHLLDLLRGKGVAPSLYTAQGMKAQYTSSYTVAKA